MDVEYHSLFLGFPGSTVLTCDVCVCVCVCIALVLVESLKPMKGR